MFEKEDNSASLGVRVQNSSCCSKQARCFVACRRAFLFCFQVSATVVRRATTMCTHASANIFKFGTKSRLGFMASAPGPCKEARSNVHGEVGRRHPRGPLREREVVPEGERGVGLRGKERADPFGHANPSLVTQRVSHVVYMSRWTPGYGSFPRPRAPPSPAAAGARSGPTHRASPAPAASSPPSCS